MTCSEPGHRALWIGPAAGPALAGGGLRVHSVFPRTVNLEVDGTGAFVALCGPPGGVHPHAVALDRPEDFRTWGLVVGSRARLDAGSLHLRTLEGGQVVHLAQAERPPARPLAKVIRLGGAFLQALSTLDHHLKDAGSPLGMPSLWTGAPPENPLGRSLHQAGLELGAAVAASPDPAHPATLRLRLAVAELVGLGAGLTPAGDDFLCGFLAATVATGRPGLPEALREATEASLGRTGGISAFLLQCGFHGFWPGPLLDLGEACAADRPPVAVAALERLMAIGHSSGADLATGFLFGLESGLGDPAQRPHHTG